MTLFRCLCVLTLVVAGCAEKDPASMLPYQANQRDMSRPGGEMGVAARDMAVAVDAMSGQGGGDIGVGPQIDSGTDLLTPGFGMIQFTEIMYDPDQLEDDDAEWVELKNVSASPLDLTGCSIADRSTQNRSDNAGALLGNSILAPGGLILLARSDDLILNGGITPDGLFEFSLANGGDQITLDCAGNEIDVVTYDDGDRFPNAKGVSIIRGIDERDGSMRWCPSTTVYDVETNQRGTPGAENDICELLSGNACWAQVDCEMNQFCMTGLCGLPPGQCDNDNDCTAEETCIERRCEVTLECQSNAECLVTESCVNNTCVEMPECTNSTDCDSGQICTNNECVPDGMLNQPIAGQLIISEFMYDPHGPVDNRLEDDRAEWIELLNVSNATLSLINCILTDASGVTAALGGLELAPNAFALGVRSDDLVENGQITADFTFDFALNNTSDTISLICDGQSIDVIAYSDPTNPAQSFQRSGDDLSGASSEMSRWCGATESYLMVPMHLGSPGRANEVCP
jgi:hypothetical protein